MKYSNYLKNSFPLYIISGIIFGLVVFSLVTIHRYNNYMLDILGLMHNINLNKSKVKNQIDEIDALGKYFKDNFGMDITDANSERLIFQALDDMKTKLRNTLITVSGFEKTGVRKELPVEIEAPMKNYKMIIDYVEYIESFRIPGYKIRHISISMDEDGKIVLNIKGALAMPSFEADT